MHMNKNMKSKIMNSKDIIITRDNASKKITNYWHIIRTENVLPKKQVAAGKYSGYDLKELYNQILQYTEARVIAKGMLNSINMGIKTFNKEDFKKTHYYTIYMACEKKEQLAQLKMVLLKCINPATKAAAGKLGLGKREVFSHAKISSMISKTQLEINELQAKIDKFNESASIETIDDAIEIAMAA